jgi:hypothetical protein
MWVHKVAEASQKLTCPMVGLVVPETTDAVSVTSLPEATDPPEATVFPPEVMVRLVVVEAGPAQTSGATKPKNITTVEDRNELREILRRMDLLRFCWQEADE